MDLPCSMRVITRLINKKPHEGHPYPNVCGKLRKKCRRRMYSYPAKCTHCGKFSSKLKDSQIDFPIPLTIDGLRQQQNFNSSCGI